MKRHNLRGWLLAGLLLCLVANAWAHYPFLRYLNDSSPYQSAPAKFDLEAIPDAVVPYYVVRPLPTLPPGQTTQSLVAQIRQAAEVWSTVRTSRLRLRFGGILDAPAGEWPSGIYIQFAELEGVLARGGPVTLDTVVQRGEDRFYPIQTSLIELPVDLRQWSIHSDEFYLTVVHEFGHALGLQHTPTSSAMTTAATRTTTRAKPLGADDIAGLALLYPAPAYETRTAKIRGRITAGGAGVHLASVMALPPSGEAVSTLTAPDGSYEIAGLPPGLYYLYVHPLPPAVNQVLGPGDVVLPVDPGGKPVPAGPPFEGVFYPNARSVDEARYVFVNAGEAAEGIDVDVRLRESFTAYGVVTYGCPGAYCLQPAFVNRTGRQNYFLAWGPQLTAGGEITPGLTVETVGGASVILPEKTRVYQPFGPEGFSYLQLYLSHHLLSGPGARHLVFRFQNDLYVLPSGVHVTDSQPPSIAFVEEFRDEEGRLAAIVRGSNLLPSTRILFDGVPAPSAGFDWETGALTVLVPPAPSGHRAVVVALDGSGQTSLFLDALAPYVFEYPDAPNYVARVASSAPLIAGANTFVEITADSGAAFRTEWTELIPSSPNVTVRRLWVAAPNRLLANVHVSPQASPGTVSFSVFNGLRIDPVSGSLPLLAAAPPTMAADPSLVNPATGRRSVYPGGEAWLRITNLPGTSPDQISVAVGGSPATVLGISGEQVHLKLPAGVPLGPAVLNVTVVGQPVPPVLVALDPPPPAIRAVTVSSGLRIPQQVEARWGELLVVYVEGLGQADSGEVEVLIGGVAHSPVWSRSLNPDQDVQALWVVVAPNVPVGSPVPLIVAVGERLSAPHLLAVAGN
ncbi:MAG: matrixin family metalloprotease [Bryobacteraceae bacterium]